MSNTPNNEPCDLCEHRYAKDCGGEIGHNVHGVATCKKYKLKWWPDTERKIAE